MKDHVIICGLGNIGFRTFELLHHAKQEMAIISSEIHDEWRWRVEEAGALFFQGDARNDDILIMAGIKQAKVILAVTDDDKVNVSIMMDARALNPTIKIISRMFDTKLGKRLSTAFGVHQMFSASELAAPIFSSSVYENLALAQFNIDGESYFVYENTITADKNQPLSIIATRPSEDKVLVANSADKYKKKSILSISQGKCNNSDLGRAIF